MKKKENDDIGTGWSSMLGKIAMGALLFEAVTGLSITFLRFHAFIQWSVLVHTIVGSGDPPAYSMVLRTPLARLL